MIDSNAANVDVTGGEDPAHVEAMLKRADGEAAPEPQVDAGDQLLAGKYKTPEELEKGYLELQKAFSSRNPEAAPEPTDTPEAEAEGSDPTDTALPPQDKPEEAPKEEAAVPDGIDFERYTQSFVENGELTKADYEELATKHGLPEAAVDIYVAGLKSKIEARGKAAVEAVGDSDTFEAVRTWASSSLPEAEFNATQEAISNAQSDEQVAVIYRMLHQRYRDSNPTEPSLVSGKGLVESKNGFRSRAEQTAAINDPRYSKDPAYRADVEQKIANATFT